MESLNVVLCISHTHGMGMSSYGPPSERRYSDNCGGTGIRIALEFRKARQHVERGGSFCQQRPTKAHRRVKFECCHMGIS